MKRSIKVFTGIAVIVLTLLACNLPTSKAIPTNLPQAEASVFPEVVQNPPVDPGSVPADSPTVTVTVTEAQLTALLAEKLAQQPDLPLQNPQVFLQNGQIEITGQSNQGFVTVDVRILMVPEIDENGQVKIRVTSAELGPVQAPAGMTDSLTNTINNNLTSAFNPSETGVRVTNITIADGTMITTGTR